MTKTNEKGAPAPDLAADPNADLAAEPVAPEPEPIPGRYELIRPLYINDRFYFAGSVLNFPEGVKPPSTAIPTGKPLFSAPPEFS